MDNKEQENDKSNLGFDKVQDLDDIKFLVQKLKSIKEIINLLEKKFFRERDVNFEK